MEVMNFIRHHILVVLNIIDIDLLELAIVFKVLLNQVELLHFLVYLFLS